MAGLSSRLFAAICITYFVNRKKVDGYIIVLRLVLAIASISACVLLLFPGSPGSPDSPDSHQQQSPLFAPPPPSSFPLRQELTHLQLGSQLHALPPLPTPHPLSHDQPPSLSDAPVGLTLSAVSESTSQKEHTTLLDADGDHATIDPATNRDPPPTSGEAALSELAEEPLPASSAISNRKAIDAVPIGPTAPSLMQHEVTTSLFRRHKRIRTTEPI
ncbi:hypothetical protein BASA50_004284 [Batrachochytrium salamandrivorans]|uniref:Uncharacterized protein n=1 Tax=Batrachochytrium salamandrivorans TaxID=1357716 RepID=A0ABQ8FJ05_9FUNG|nr:hypothetical protein BASA61_009624 [Batrachochytrium salamandrivorans]KAH6581396.1 hypothetical protein BASA60_002453 [Batrachochytrium salamandrivorans]KAH6597679.1 hypothetical protein BASA50_004284 [Batrachochytrium salamandrivorans]KAH9249078.1 hypothetical protein BASA81_013197 [Batrachochytrium salamandrivorans]